MNYIKLNTAPVWVVKYPECGSCTVELDTDGDGWVCPVCGSSWSMDAGDGDTGMLYEDWSGEPLSGEAVDDGAAFRAGMKFEREQREETLARIRART